MSDSDKTKEQLIEELKALRGQVVAGAAETTDGPGAAGGLTRREILSGWVAPVILTVPLVPRSGRAQTQGNDPEADFAAFPTKLNLQVDEPAGPTGFPTLSPTPFPTLSPTPFPTSAPTLQPTFAPTLAPTFAPTLAPTFAPTLAPTFAPTLSPTFAPTAIPTASPTVTIPVEVTEFDVNG